MTVRSWYWSIQLSIILERYLAGRDLALCCMGLKLSVEYHTPPIYQIEVIWRY